MATTHLAGEAVQTTGDLPEVGAVAPAFTLVGEDLSDITLADYAGKRVVLNVFPSVDTGICAQSVRVFNEKATALDNTVVLCVSKDLPFALGRFCAAEGIENVVSGSDFRGTFGADYGVEQADGALCGLLARAVIVIDTDGKVGYVQLVDEIKTEPDYDAAIAYLSA